MAATMTARFCGRCGAALAPGAGFCGRCGTPVLMQAAIARQPVYSYAPAPPITYPRGTQGRLPPALIAGGLVQEDVDGPDCASRMGVVRVLQQLVEKAAGVVPRRLADERLVAFELADERIRLNRGTRNRSRARVDGLPSQGRVRRYARRLMCLTTDLDDGLY